MERRADSSPVNDIVILGSIDPEKLRAEIKKDRGEVFALVHPFYPIVPKAHLVTQEEIDTHQRRMIEFFKTYKPPIFVFEEFKRIHQTKDLLLSKGCQTERIVFIPTVDNNPGPFNPIDEFNLSRRWDQLIKIFSGFGVTEINLGGRILHIDGTEQSGCVAAANVELKRGGLKTNFSDLCFPGKPYWRSKTMSRFSDYLRSLRS